MLSQVVVKASVKSAQRSVVSCQKGCGSEKKLAKTFASPVAPHGAPAASASYMTSSLRHHQQSVNKKGVARVAKQQRAYHVSSQLASPPQPWDGVAHEVLGLPALSPSMESGNLANWVKKEGEKVSAGDVIAEVETDKATVAWEATEDGYVAKHLVPAGTKNLKVGESVVIIVPKKDQVSKFASYSRSSTSASAPSPAASPKTEAPAPTPAAAPSKAAAPKPSVPHQVVPMPALSPTMEEGVIASWKKKEGDKIAAGDVLAEIETDKATVAFEATEDGYLAKILIPASSQRIKVNVPVAITVNKAADIPAVKDYNPGVEGAAREATPSAPAASAPSSTPSSSAAQAPVSSQDGRVIASPYAKKLANERIIPLNEVRGSGPGGRIIAADVLSFVPAAKTQAPSKAQTSPKTTVADLADYEDLSVSNIRRITAERLSHSKQTIPHYYLTMDCQVDELMKVRAKLNAAATKGEYKLSVNDFVVKASAQALLLVPQVNSEWRGDVIRHYHNVDINVAVSTEAGLLTPIVRDADMKGLVAISESVKMAALKAKDNKLSPTDLATGTFTISNLGMFGIDQFAAVINPPQACILAVGASCARVVPASAPSSPDSPPFTVKTFMTVTLSCDHRVVDGAVGARWLQAFKDYIENPLKLLL